MAFLVPFGLLALLTLPLILLLHLIRERRRRVAVPSLILWQNLPRRMDAQRRRRLPLTLLLLLHLLAAALIALALGQPQWLGLLFGSGQHLAVVIDTSASMGARTSGLNGAMRLDQVRDRARALVGGLRGGDTLTLVAAGPQARLVETGNAESRSRLLSAIDDLAIDGVGTDVASALTLAQAALESYPDGRVVVLSDSALPALDNELANVPRKRPIDWESIGATLDNRAVVTLAARSWNNAAAENSDGRAAVQVYARVANYSQTSAATSLRLFSDETLIDTRAVNLQANGETELTWTLPAGTRLLRAELDGRDALPADDIASLSLAPPRPVNALLVSATPAALERALKAVPGVSVAVVAPGAYATSQLAARADLTVFDGILPEAWPTGGVLVINPPLGGDRPGDAPLQATSQMHDLARETDRVVQPSPAVTLFDGLSLGGVNFGSVRRLEVPSWARVQLTAGDLPLVLRGRTDKSEVTIWAFDVQRGNLTTRLAFPLLVARTVRDLTPATLPSSLSAGEVLALQPGPRVESLELRDPDGQSRSLPLAANRETTVQAALSTPGVYTLLERSGSETLFEGRIAVNAGAAIESDLRPRPIPSGLDQGLSSAAQSNVEAGALPDRQPLWLWLVAGALIVMMVEWIYVHRRLVGNPQ